MDTRKLFLDNPSRRRIYAEKNGIKVGLAEIALTPTRCGGSCRPNPPVRIYDTAGAWADENFHFDPSKGLPKIREKWLERRATRRLSGLWAIRIKIPSEEDLSARQRRAAGRPKCTMQKRASSRPKWSTLQSVKILPP